MSVVVLAYHEFGCVGLETLLRRGVEVSAVFTYADDPDENVWFRSVAEIARAAGIPVHLTESINDPEWVARVAALRPDVIFSFYYRDMVKKALRDIPRFGAVNLHGSLLPRYRGRSPLNWQLVHGEARSGVTLHHMVARADAGDIIGQEAVDVGPDDTAIELYRKLLPAAVRLLERHLDGILAGTAPRTPQDESRATLFGGRRPEDGRLSWAWPRRRIHDLVRAVAPPWPGAFAELPEGPMMLLASRCPAPAGCPASAAALAPGEVLLAGGRLLVGAADGPLEILECQLPPGRGLRTGDRLGASAAPVPTQAAGDSLK